MVLPVEIKKADDSLPFLFKNKILILLTPVQYLFSFQDSGCIVCQ